jgi:quercetin dioxygenase-like cupin family protein
MRSAAKSLVFAVLCLPAAGLWADSVSVGYSPPSRKETMGTTFVPWDSLTGAQTAVGVFRPAFDAPTPTLDKLEVHVTTLEPGKASHPPHHHPWEEMILVREGTLEVSVNGKAQTAAPGSLIFFASNDAHNCTNIGAAPATYYVINFVTDAALSRSGRPPAAEGAQAGLLASGVTASAGQPSQPTPTGSFRRVLDSATLTFQRLECHVTTLNAGAQTSPGIRDPGDEIFIVRSGSIEATVRDVSCRLCEGSFFYVAPNDPRTLRNTGKEAASYQVIKVVSARTPAAAND